MPSDRTPHSSRAVSAWCVIAAFGAYFCMYGFRKPFTVAAFEATSAWGLAFKPIAVISQVLGYTAAKFIGIKAIAELDPKRRVAMLLGLIAAAEAALVGFALTPPPWTVAWLLLNGLSLGMVFGLVLGFLEGRRHTEALAAALCTSFIVADGVTKSVGANLLNFGVGEYWMPAGAGLLFAAPMLVFAWMLTRIPPPTSGDVAARSERAPMSRADRRTFFCRYGVGLSLIVVMYLLVTILRSVRSDFAPEIWAGLGVDVRPAVYAWLEMAIAFGVLVLNGSAVLIANNRQAFFFALALAAGGAAVVLAASAGLAVGMSPYAYMFLQGLGLYLPYIAVHTTIFERLIAMTRDRGNIGYLMYLADAIGYLGYVVVLLVRETVKSTADFLPFYDRMSICLAIACIATIIPAWRYFAAHATLHATSTAPAPAGAS